MGNIRAVFMVFAESTICGDRDERCHNESGKFAQFEAVGKGDAQIDVFRAKYHNSLTQ